MGGPHPYSNELYWYPVGGGNSVSHFTYDLRFYVDNGNAPQSLEFDVIQAFGGTRWTFGTQCHFNQSGSGISGILLTKCGGSPRFHATTSHRKPGFIWFGTSSAWAIRCTTSTLALPTATTHDTYYTAQPQWYQEEIDVAFQLDGNYEQQPYDVWLDKVTLNAY